MASASWGGSAALRVSKNASAASLFGKDCTARTNANALLGFKADACSMVACMHVSPWVTRPVSKGSENHCRTQHSRSATLNVKGVDATVRHGGGLTDTIAPLSSNSWTVEASSPSLRTASNNALARPSRCTPSLTDTASAFARAAVMCSSRVVTTAVRLNNEAWRRARYTLPQLGWDAGGAETARGLLELDSTRWDTASQLPQRAASHSCCSTLGASPSWAAYCEVELEGAAKSHGSTSVRAQPHGSTHTQANRHTDTQTHRQTDRHTHRRTHKS